LKKTLMIFIALLMLVMITACERPSTIAPIAVTATKEAPATTPTLMIKTPVKVATQASGFQEILSATQTAVATMRFGTLTATAATVSPDMAISGTPGVGTPGVLATPMALGTIYPGTAVPKGGTPVAGTPGAIGTQSISGLSTMTIPTATKFIPNFPVIPGVPTFGVMSVVGDSTVTIMTSEFPTKSQYTILMGPYGTRGLGGTMLGTFNTDAGGQMTLVFNIPATLKGFSPIDIRIEFPDGRYAFNFFYNISAN
jgi:hypothetical protein